jgi:non-specific serine/threonine protein kinase
MTIETQQKRKYSFSEPAGETNNSRTFCAQELTYQRDVFIKAIAVSGDSAAVKSALVHAEAEAKAMIAVGMKTPRVPVVHEYFYDPPTRTFYIVMQLIRGKTLADRIAEGSLYPKDVLRALADVCDVLGLMQKSNYVHKDLKPANIMLTEDGVTYLIDFGSAVRTTLLGREGTEAYRAPEMEDVSRHKNMDRSRSDIFSIGVILYEYFAGKRPHEDEEYRRGNQAWAEFVEPKALAPGIPDEVNALIVKCMKYSPKDRYELSRLKAELRRLQNRVRYVPHQGGAK